MKERPILFSAPMVRAILAGTKTQTRRAMRDQVIEPGIVRMTRPGCCEIVNEHGISIPGFSCPYGQPGDRMWVRETFAHIYRDNRRPDERRDDDVAYKADHQGLDEYAYGSWKPSIHMPRWASRITLEITGVRVERLQDISEADAISEGIESAYESWRDYRTDPAVNFPCADSPISSYQTLWESINGPGSWEANPWVWVLEFKRIERSAA